MSVLETFRDVVKQRLQALLWRSMASEVETDAILQDVANFDRIEQRARQYEAEGKPRLAELLRQRASAVDADAPGGSIVAAIESLSAQQLGAGMLTDQRKPENPSGQEDAEEGTPPAAKRAQSRRRRRKPSAEANCGDE